MKEPRIHCKDCVFWDLLGQATDVKLGLSFGLCRVDSPKARDNGSGAWPDTWEDWWCGKGLDEAGNTLEANTARMAADLRRTEEQKASAERAKRPEKLENRAGS